MIRRSVRRDPQDQRASCTTGGARVTSPCRASPFGGIPGVPRQPSMKPVRRARSLVDPRPSSRSDFPKVRLPGHESRGLASELRALRFLVATRGNWAGLLCRQLGPLVRGPPRTRELGAIANWDSRPMPVSSILQTVRDHPAEEAYNAKGCHRSPLFQPPERKERQ